MSSLKVGQKAPALTLPAFPGEKVKLSSFQGTKNVVLYFYPRNNTPGCTTEACDFRDSLSQFDQGDCVVLGVSPDSVASHQKFAEKHGLPFTLLSDEDHAIAEKYGAWGEKTSFGKKTQGIIRSTFLINKEGKIAAIWSPVKVAGHALAVAEKLKEISE